MKKILTLFIAASLMLTACSSGTTSGVSGTFEGTAAGRNGDITVSVTLDNDKITDVTVTSAKETENIGTVATEELPAKIVEAQSYGVDSISGATLSSFGVKNAVKNALEAAGVDTRNYSQAPEHEENQNYEYNGSVVVVGGGGAGLASAVSALQSGAESVIVVEKTDLVGGDTNVNGGIYNTYDWDLQKNTEMTDGNKSLIEAAIAEEPVSDEHAALQAQLKKDYDEYLASGETGTFDSAAWFALQTWNGGDKVGNLSLVEYMADNSLTDLEWLESLGAQFKDEITQGPGSLYPRTHDTTTGLGAEFIDTYMNYILENYGDKCTIYYGVTADELLVDENNTVYGVHGTDKYNNEYTFSADNGVVLATGGFAGNVEMRVKYCQGEKWTNLGSDVGCTGVASDTGDGIVMAEAIGANLVDMDQIQLLHTCSPVNGTTDDNSQKGKSVSSVIFVNAEGNRFVKEDGRRDEICNAVLEQTNSMFYYIESWDGNPEDATMETMLTNNGVSYAEEVEKGNMFVADTLEELAEKTGMNPDNLVAAVEEYNKNVDEGATSDSLGRTTFVNKIENGPFIAVPRKPSAHHTMGGVEINTDTQVLDTEGNVIAGLYAAGEVTGGIHGGNRLGGNAIVDTVVFGKTAGENAAKFTK